MLNYKIRIIIVLALIILPVSANGEDTITVIIEETDNSYSSDSFNKVDTNNSRYSAERLRKVAVVSTGLFSQVFTILVGNVSKAIGLSSIHFTT